MRLRLISAITITAVLCCCCGLARAADAPFPPIPDGATVDQVLSALKLRGDQLKDFSADVSLSTVEQTTGDSYSDSGNVLFQKVGDDDSRIRVTFAKHIIGDRIMTEKHEYTIADGKLDERDYDKKAETVRQVVKPGEKIKILKLGEGPFPMPIGQDPDEVKRQFDVALVPPAADDPKGTVHIQLKPKAQTDMARRFAQIDVWVDRQQGMPVQIVTLDSPREHIQTALLTNLKLNAGLTDADFTLPPVQGWSWTEEPYQ
jgi:outer membrane lipoprotein-sorting protein